MMEEIVKCWICGAFYKRHSMYCGDQSTCGECARLRQKAVDSPTPEQVAEQDRKRRAFFGVST